MDGHKHRDDGHILLEAYDILCEVEDLVEIIYLAGEGLDGPPAGAFIRVAALAANRIDKIKLNIEQYREAAGHGPQQA